MKRVFLQGAGAISPAGWDLPSLSDALAAGQPLPTVPLPRPGWERPLTVRKVIAPAVKPAFLGHPRLRRASSITVYAAGAALEALAGPKKSRRLGVIFCVTGGCVQFSRRFYDETWHDPVTASPLVFPETVFNAPSSHLSALLESVEVNYTFVGDAGTFLQALGTAAEWLVTDRVDGCLVIGAEELDWITADACRHFSHGTICTEGAGAVYLSCDQPATEPAVELIAITDSHLYLNGRSRMQTMEKMRASLSRCLPEAILCDSQLGQPGRDRDEAKAWVDWRGPRLSPKKILGEGLMASSAWQCVAAIDLLQRREYAAALISVCGGHQQAIGAHFARV